MKEVDIFEKEMWNTVFERLELERPRFQSNITLDNGLIIKNRKQFVKSIVKKDKVVSFDTETYKGTCKLLALCEVDKQKNKYILNPTFEQCLEYLMYKANDSKFYRFFYNIDFDISAILKLWNDLESIKRLLKGITVFYKGFSLSWFKSRLFVLRKGHKTVHFTDLFNFFKIGLEKASEQFLKEIHKDNINGRRLNISKTYWKKNELDIIKYCIKDCNITSLLGNELVEAIKETKVELPRYLVSNASLSKQDFRFHCRINRISHIPNNIIQIAYNCYYGGRFEIFKRGTFNNLFLYDINSQYPFFIRNLPNIKYGAWKRIDKDYVLDKEMIYGYFNVDLDIPDDIKIPTLPINHKGIIKFPNGYIEKWTTWFDLDLVRKYIKRIKDGYIFYPETNINKPNRSYKPFEKRIDFHFKNKARFKQFDNKILYNISKYTMNSLYGCFIERHKSYDKFEIESYNSGILFNPFYASQITGFGRWSVLKDVKIRDYKYLTAIHTDSLISEKPLNYLDISDKLGSWNLEKEGSGMLINTGMYQIDDLIKTRGIPLKYIKNWFDFANKNKDLSIKKFKIFHMKKISESLSQDKNLINTNTMEIIPRKININSDTKRHWFDDFKNFDDLLSRNIDSLPFTIQYSDLNKFELHPNYIAYQINTSY